MFPIINNTPPTPLIIPPDQFSHLPLSSQLGPYHHQELFCLWHFKLKLPLHGSWPATLHFLHSVTWSTPVLWSLAFLFSQLAPSCLTFTVFLPSLLPSFHKLLNERFLCASHCTVQVYNVERDVAFSPYSCLSTLLPICLSAKPPPVSYKPSTLSLHSKLIGISTSCLRQTSLKHSSYLFYSLSRPSSTPKPTVVRLPPPPLHWVVKWSSNYTMQWMFAEFALLGLQTTFDTSCVTLGKSLNHSFLICEREVIASFW